jgi:hypothetical protein
MRLLILAALLAAPSSAATPPDAAVVTDQAVNTLRAPGSDCKRPDLQRADTPLKPEMKKLGELPQGDLILSVYNEVDGCMAPVIVRYGEPRAIMPVPLEPVRPRASLFR